MSRSIRNHTLVVATILTLLVVLLVGGCGRQETYKARSSSGAVDVVALKPALPFARVQGARIARTGDAAQDHLYGDRRDSLPRCPGDREEVA